MYFESTDGQTLWNPASTVGDLFVAHVRAAERLTDQPSGISEVVADTATVDGLRLASFAAATQQGHVVARALLRPLVVVAAALLERAGISASGLPDDIMREAAGLLPAMPT